MAGANDDNFELQAPSSAASDKGSLTFFITN